MGHDRGRSEFDRVLAGGVVRTGAALCVGIDPVVERMPEPLRGDEPAAAFEAFSRGVVDSVGEHSAAVKFQSACYERLGADGVAVLGRCMHAARESGVAVILDAKRGDIGISARHYAKAAVDLGAHAITVNAYLGMETVDPFVEAGLAVFVLVRTSNPGSADVQDVAMASGDSVAMHVGRQVAAFGRERPGVHAVVGATQHEVAEAMRSVMPDPVFLLPGIGAQGATVADLAAFMKPAESGDPTRGVLPTASRSVIYAGSGSDWAISAAAAAASLRRELGALQSA